MKARRKKTELALLPYCKAPTDREKMWAAIRQERRFTKCKIAELAGCNNFQVKDYLLGLMAAGFVARIESLSRHLSVYELVRDTGVDAPRVRKDGTLLPLGSRARIWATMRILKTFTAMELVNAASLPEAPITRAEALRYCRWLTLGGYLAESGLGSPDTQWTFIPARFTGAKAPQILRFQRLFDPNTGAVVYESAPEGRDDE